MNHSRKAIKIASAKFWILVLIKAYQQVRILVPEGVEVVEFYHLQIPKSMIDNIEDFPIVQRIPEDMISLVHRLTHVLIHYWESILDVSHAPIPKKYKSKPTRVVIKEITNDEQPMKKKKATSVLKTYSSKKQVAKPVKHKIKKKVVDDDATNKKDVNYDDVIVDTEDKEETDTKVQEPIQT